MKRPRIPIIYWGILAATGGMTFSFGLGCLLTFGQDVQATIFNLFLFSGGVFSAEMVTILHQTRGSESECAYEAYLRKMGIIKIYERRDLSYVEDLSYELNHLGKKQQTVRMLGVSLKFYFIDDGLSARDEMPIPWIIKDQAKKHIFQALVCNVNNQELFQRNKITNELGLTCEAEYNVESEVNIVQDINKVIAEVDHWKKTDSKLNISIQHYDFAPYATIIFINDKIYYTPNMPYEKRRTEGGNRKNPHPTLCVLLNSELGYKLSGVFEIALKMAESDNTLSTDL